MKILFKNKDLYKEANKKAKYEKTDLSHIKVFDIFGKKINCDMKNAKVKRDISENTSIIKFNLKGGKTK